MCKGTKIRKGLLKLKWDGRERKNLGLDHGVHGAWDFILSLWSQSQQHWSLEWDLCWGDCPVHWGMFSPVPDTYSLDGGSSPPLPAVTKCPPPRPTPLLPQLQLTRSEQFLKQLSELGMYWFLGWLFWKETDKQGRGESGDREVPKEAASDPGKGPGQPECGQWLDTGRILSLRNPSQGNRLLHASCYGSGSACCYFLPCLLASTLFRPSSHSQCCSQKELS